MCYWRLPIVVLFLLSLVPATVESVSFGVADVELEQCLLRAAENRTQIEAALDGVPTDQRNAMRWLILGMPDSDLKSLDAEFLIENCQLAHQVWRSSPWHEQVPEQIFREAILPYASIDETRERWRQILGVRCTAMVDSVSTPAAAATKLNREIFQTFGVKYSTQRPKANQSPAESIEAGLASCSGLSVLLIDACRSVGVPARFVGTPLWSDGSGNHSWVEIWDGTEWRFTGAAEPTGDDLDRAWFTGRAASARRDDPRNAIYATTWRKTPIHFPLVWSPQDRSVYAVDVTDRYTESTIEVPTGQARVRFRVRDEDGVRLAAPIAVVDSDGAELFRGQTRDERFDANDHLTALLPLDGRYTVQIESVYPDRSKQFRVDRDEQLVEMVVPAAGSEVSQLSDALANDLDMQKIAAEPWADSPISAFDAARARELLLSSQKQRVAKTRSTPVEEGTITIGSHSMKYATRVFGERPPQGHSLWISMHGGGGAPASVNDQQWENQKKLYQVEEGIYLAPRAPTDSWNLWHQGHIDPLFDRLIADFVTLHGVDPDRIYLMGYSAGGDGVYQLAPRMADRFAAAAMMAGHPNETRPDGLRNLPFTLHMGGEDSAYRRNEVAREWKVKLSELRSEDSHGYEHWVEIYEGKGHWIDREDAAALPWMQKFRRNLRPTKIVWLQDDVTHPRFYWLHNATPKKGARVVLHRSGQEIEIEAAEGIDKLSIRLDDSMLDLDKEVVIKHQGRELYRAIPPRTIATLIETLTEREDPRGTWSAEVTVELSQIESKKERRAL